MMNQIKQFEHLKIPLEAIKSATDNFADINCIGRGGFGKVYKGDLVHPNGQTMVAIKRLDREFGQGDREFWKEIMMLSIFKHVNIISLIGFCAENDEKILVYEFASKRSLHLYLDNSDLTWVRRLEICIGAARGLACLHGQAETQQRVLHCDIKSSNILLDENWNAKISDFGLSKFAPANQPLTILFSDVVGTPGYCDPLYAEAGLLTKESDVYSFGVVLFEVLCGRLCIRDNNDWHRPFPLLVRKCYEQNKINDIIYDTMKDEINTESLNEFTSIAYQCLKNDREERPLTKEIVRRLEIALEYQVPNCERMSDVLPVSSSPNESPKGYKLVSSTRGGVTLRPSENEDNWYKNLVQPARDIISIASSSSESEDDWYETHVSVPKREIISTASRPSENKDNWSENVIEPDTKTSIASRPSGNEDNWYQIVSELTSGKNSIESRPFENEDNLYEIVPGLTSGKFSIASRSAFDGDGDI